MLDVLEQAFDYIEGGVTLILDAPELVELAPFARREDLLVRRQMEEIALSGREPMYEALFR
jgi:hypothetical protein